MNSICLPFAALALFLLAACQTAAPTAPVAPQQPRASTAIGDSIVTTEAARGGNMFGSGT